MALNEDRKTTTNSDLRKRIALMELLGLEVDKKYALQQLLLHIEIMNIEAQILKNAIEREQKNLVDSGAAFVGKGWEVVAPTPTFSESLQVEKV